MNDKVRAAIIALAMSALPVGQILNLYELTGDQVATIGLFITNAVTVLALVIKTGQQPGAG